jgi:hypothetical protein
MFGNRLRAPEPLARERRIARADFERRVVDVRGYTLEAMANAHADLFLQD